MTVNASNSGTFVFNGAITGSGGLTRTNTYSTLILAGNNSYAGPTTISAGTLQIGNDGATGTLGSGPVSIASGATLRFDRTGTVDVPNDISGAGSLLITWCRDDGCSDLERCEHVHRRSDGERGFAAHHGRGAARRRREEYCDRRRGGGACGSMARAAESSCRPPSGL